MFKYIIFSACFASFTLAVNAQTINVYGKISNQAGTPISAAIVTLAGQGMSDTTGSDGAYVITTKTASRTPLLQPQQESVILINGGLALSLPEPSAVTVQIFDVNGTLLRRDFLPNVSTGFYRFNITENRLTPKLLIIKAIIGQTAMTFRYLPLSKGKYSGSNSTGNSSWSVNSQLAKMAAINDTLKITAAGYAAKSVAIVSYDQKLDITLDTAGNGSTGSTGCGKTLSTLKSGYQKISSASLNRTYYLDIPTNYDPKKPYRLIFGMHCMGSSDTGVVAEKFYSLKPLADKNNIPCIFVAPQGYTDGSPWRSSPNDNKDHIFFDDMLTLFKAELCVDTTRVFCAGFSFGAMFSYALSTNHQNVLRAVATYAPANWNIYLPTNTHLPIAYYQTTGTGDNLCSWVNSDARKEGGKYCVLQHLEDNGCPAPANIPLANSGKHVTTEFAGCPEEYPVVFSSHNGGHQGTASDQGSSENWIAKETWDFFMRF